MEFTQIPNWAIQHASQLSGTAWQLYCLLLMHRNRKSDKCCPSWEALGWNRAKYYRARLELVAAGWCDFDGLNVSFSQNLRISESQNLRISESETNQSRKVRQPVSESETNQSHFSRLAYKEEPEEIEPEEKEPEEIEPERSADARPAQVADTRGALLSARHPSLAAIKRLSGYLPNKILWPDCVAVLGDLPDYPKLESCFKEWTRRGHKPTNYDWAFDWYVNGIPERRPTMTNALAPTGDALVAKFRQAETPKTRGNAEAAAAFIRKGNPCETTTESNLLKS